jgi:hypothetical protein
MSLAIPKMIRMITAETMMIKVENVTRLNLSKREKKPMRENLSLNFVLRILLNLLLG